LPSALTLKKRRALERISYDELMSNAGMSGFVSFLEHDPKARVPASGVGAVKPLGGAVEASAGVLNAAQPAPAKPGRIRRANKVEDGHSLAEQAVYEALWQAGTPVSAAEPADRTIRIGYQRLAQMTRLSWVSVKANLRTLEKKLAIAVTGCENSATREGKSYLVYSRPAILERRKQAGLEWVRRTRGVELLTALEKPDSQNAG
jgi:hypothetical protein